MIMRVVGCFLEYGDQFVIIKRHPDKDEGNSWDIAAGKVDPGETDTEACVREVFEETGIVVSEESLEFLGEYVYEFPGKTVVFLAYRSVLDSQLPVILNLSEHIDYKWVTAKEAYAMDDLMDGFHELLEKIGYYS